MSAAGARTIGSTGSITISQYVDPTSTQYAFGEVYFPIGNTASSSYSNALFGAGNATLTGANLLLLGKFAGAALTTGTQNIFFGVESGKVTTEGGYNCGFGCRSLYYNTTGAKNTAIGWRAGGFDASGAQLATPENSVYIGYDARGFSDADDNAIVIGYESRGMGANTAVLGNTSITSTYLRGNITVTSGADTVVLGISAGDWTITPSGGNVNIIAALATGGATNKTTWDSAGHQEMEGTARPWRDELSDALSLQQNGPGVSRNVTEGTVDFAHNAVRVQ